MKLLLDTCTFLWAEDCVLVTPDSHIHRYPVRVLW